MPPIRNAWPGSGSTGSGTTSGTVSKAVADCREQAAKISDATAKSVAEQGCDALEKSDGQIDKALSKAKQSCIDGANKISVETLKEQALKACDKIQ